MDRELERLIQCKHHDPHSILGVHPTEHGALFRCLRPEALSVEALAQGERAVPLKQIAPGVWEAELHYAQHGPGITVSAKYAGGVHWEVLDSYSFLPTLGDVDIHLFGEGQHWHLYQKLGAHEITHQGIQGVAFAVWAPGATGVSVVGDFDHWDGRLHPMRSLGGSGVWEIFMPGLKNGSLYKYEIRPQHGPPFLKTDPYSLATEAPPSTASKVFKSAYAWKDDKWLKQRSQAAQRQPMLIYEIHLGSWRRKLESPDQPMTYRELAPLLADYCVDMGFTHVELMPVMEHPFGPSWGYQVGAYFAPTARWGTPDDFRFMVDTLHQKGIGVLLDWVPAHFPKDAHALGRFAGEALYEHQDPRQGEHPDWGTYIFNFGRHEVRNFLIANALFWLKEYHTDGLRIDAVASMLYLDYSREGGQWVPNPYGGRENLEAIHFLKRLNEEAHAQVPGTLMVAEESTAWPGVSRPTYLGGLGFGFKWNMGWMHDTLDYFAKDPVYRQHHHKNLTFGFLYAWSENFILPISHDEVVHGKGSLWDKMPGDRWQKAANLRCFYAYMWAHPGKKLLFMGCEFGQVREWQHDQSLDWHLTQYPEHGGIQRLVRDLNRVYKAEPALWDLDGEPGGFEWLDGDNGGANVIAFARRAADLDRTPLVFVGNFSPVSRRYRVGLPAAGFWNEVINTDKDVYAGTGQSNGRVHSEHHPWQGQQFSVEISLPPLAAIWLQKEV
jgi:1,4-alpha-glucan branching enzyme